MREQHGPSFPPVAQAAHNGENIPVSCQLYGHSWERTAHPGVKHCALCHVDGYCPECTPFPPTGSQPFSCTAHTRHRQVQPWES